MYQIFSLLSHRSLGEQGTPIGALHRCWRLGAAREEREDVLHDLHGLVVRQVVAHHEACRDAHGDAQPALQALYERRPPAMEVLRVQGLLAP